MVSIQSRCVKKIIQSSLGIMAMLLAFVVGPETHVHQGEGPNQETVVHVHFGIVGHVHGASPSGPGISPSDTEGPAVYLNAFSTVTTHASVFPFVTTQLVRFLPPQFSVGAEFSSPEVNAHAPPLIDSIRPRSPPRKYSA